MIDFIKPTCDIPSAFDRRDFVNLETRQLAEISNEELLGLIGKIVKIVFKYDKCIAFDCVILSIKFCEYDRDSDDINRIFEIERKNENGRGTFQMCIDELNIFTIGGFKNV